MPTKEERLKYIPGSKKGVYKRAMEGRSRAAAIKAFCCECVGWTYTTKQIGECADTGCPLYPYRPWKG
jgi:hypothetical protein